jgi:hypothetical protein
MERFLRNIFLIFLLLSMLLLLGSGRDAQMPVKTSEAQQTALLLKEIVPKGDSESWEKAAAENPLWLLRVTSAKVPR